MTKKEHPKNCFYFNDNYYLNDYEIAFINYNVRHKHNIYIHFIT